MKKNGMYQDAADLFYEIRTYNDSMEQYYKSIYKLGKKKISSGDYTEAKTCLKKISEYKDAGELYKECDYRIAIGYYKDKKYKKAMSLFEKLKNYSASKKYVKKCKKKIEEEEEFLKVEYVVNDSKKDEKGQYYSNGTGTLILRSDGIFEDWVGFNSGDYVTSTIPQSSIKFRLANKGKKAVVNPRFSIEFDNIWLRTLYGDWEGINHIHGVGGFGGVKVQYIGKLDAGTSADITLFMSEAYFVNGETSNMVIKVSADNYKQRKYNVKVKIKEDAYM